jgi:serine/threonine protein kinase
MTSSFAPDTTFAMDDIVQRVEQFMERWKESEEPSLGEFLPAEPLHHRRCVLIELIKFDLEQRTARGTTVQIESYTREFPELLENGEPPCDLIYEEYHIRRQAGHSVAPRQYYERFPRSAEALKRLMGTEDLSQSTQLFVAKRIEGFAAGQRIDDFDLMVELGKGAFATVFLARQISMQRIVALKISADKGTEPQTLASLDHPNIIRVYDQRTITGNQKIRVLYMQFAPGGTLADVVRYVRGTPAASRTGEMLGLAVKDNLMKSGTFAGDESALKRRLANVGWPETVCRIGVQLAQALDHAHKQGTLHRDVKPANVLLGADGTPKLADFNISFSSQLDGATPAAYFGGSLAYMSPEQLEACNPTHERKPEELDGRSDLFGLAVLLWELLHGERPFVDEEMTAGWTAMLDSMTERRKTESPKSPPATRDPVTQRLEKVLRKALAPEANDRHADGTAMARDLALCLNPHAWDLMHDLGSGWRSFAKRHPYVAMFPVNLPAFAVAGFFNFWYNWTYFIEPLRSEDFERAFKALIPYVNGTLYPLGVVLFLLSTVPVARALARIRRGETLDADVLRKARRRAMTLGHYVAFIGLALWIIAGFWFPTGMWVEVGEIPKGGYSHFLLAMLACGIISACFPFLATTWLTVRVFFPALLANSAPEPREQRQLTSLMQWAGRYLAISTVAPAMIAILLLMVSDDQNPHKPDSRLAIGILIAASILGFGLAYVVYQRIRADLTALSIATRPMDMSGTTTDSVQSF